MAKGEVGAEGCSRALLSGFLGSLADFALLPEQIWLSLRRLRREFRPSCTVSRRSLLLTLAHVQLPAHVKQGLATALVQEAVDNTGGLGYSSAFKWCLFTSVRVMSLFRRSASSDSPT